MNDIDKARDAFTKEVANSKGSLDQPGWRIIDYQLLGMTKLASSKDVEALAVTPDITDSPFFFAFEVALAFNSVGDSQRALDWLEKAEAAGNHSINFLAVDPRVKNLHSEPRFQKLLGKLL